MILTHLFRLPKLTTPYLWRRRSIGWYGDYGGTGREAPPEHLWEWMQEHRSEEAAKEADTET